MLNMETQLPGLLDISARELQKKVDYAARKTEKAGALGQRATLLRGRLARIDQRKRRLISFYQVFLNGDRNARQPS